MEKLNPHVPITLKFLAEKLKMSVSTVSKALNDYPTINEYTKKRVQELARELNFTPNKSAINLKDRKSRIIGIILPNLLDYFFNRSIAGIEQLAMKNGYNVIISQSHDDFEKEVALANMLLKTCVDGLIIAVSQHTKNFEHLNQFENIGTPIVYYARNPSLNLACHKVLGNDFQGAYTATKFLIDRGHKKIAYLGGPKMINFTHERFKGYINALNDAGTAFNQDLVGYTNFNNEDTIEATKKIFENTDEMPTALVAYKEPILFDALKYLKKENHPRFNEIDSIGFGNTPLISYLAYPPIASIDEDPENVGEKTIELLLKLINKEIEINDYQKITVNCKLIIH